MEDINHVLPTPEIANTTFQFGTQQMTGQPFICYKTPTILKEDGSTVGIGGQFLLEKWFTYTAYMGPNAWQDSTAGPGAANFQSYTEPKTEAVNTSGGFNLSGSISTPICS